MRLFAAIPVGENAISALEQIQESWRTALGEEESKVRWARPEQIHLTLRFFGNVPDNALTELVSVFGKVVAKHPPMNLSLGGVGAFPSPKRARVMWAGLTGDIEQLAALQSEINEATARFGQAPEDRPFHPHLTIGRTRERSHVSRLAETTGSVRIAEAAWKADSVHLMQSTLSSGGPKYECLAKLVLSPATTSHSHST